MSGIAPGVGLRRLQHLVLWVADVERSVRFYRDLLGFEEAARAPRAAVLKIPGSSDDHHLGLFEQPGVRAPDDRVARMYHSAWEVGDLTDLVRARQRLAGAGALVGASDHGVSLCTPRTPTAWSSRSSGRCPAAARCRPGSWTSSASWRGGGSPSPSRETAGVARSVR